MKADRGHAYTQLTGEYAEFSMLFQQKMIAYDSFKLYQIKSDQERIVQIMGAKDPSTAQVMKFSKDNQALFSSEALQQARNSEHYDDELVSCAQKLFEPIGLVQLSFPESSELDQKIERVATMLKTAHDVVPRSVETRREIAAAKAIYGQLELLITNQQKENLTYIEQATKPIDDLLAYLRQENTKAE